MKSVCEFGQHVLHRALARTSAEPAAMQEGIERAVGLIGVAGGRIEEAVDARGDMRHQQIGSDDAAGAGEPQRADPHQIDARHIEQRPPHQRDQKRLAEIRLEDQQHGEDGVERNGKLEAGNIATLLALVEEPRRQHDEGGLDELGRLDGKEAELHPAPGALDLGSKADESATSARCRPRR